MDSCCVTMDPGAFFSGEHRCARPAAPGKNGIEHGTHLRGIVFSRLHSAIRFFWPHLARKDVTLLL